MAENSTFNTNLDNLYYLLYSNMGVFTPSVILQLYKLAKTDRELNELCNLLVNFPQLNTIFMDLFPKLVDYARYITSKDTPILLTPTDTLRLLKNPPFLSAAEFITGGYKNIKEIPYIKDWGVITPQSTALLCSFPSLLPVDCVDYRLSILYNQRLYNLQFEGVIDNRGFVDPVFYISDLSLTILPTEFLDTPCVENYL